MTQKVQKVLRLIERQVRSLKIPWVTQVSKKKKGPFKVLVSCILSLRTKDKITQASTENFFKVAKDPNDVLRLKVSQIEKLIYPVGFYRNKARVLIGIARHLVNEYKGRVPSSEEALLRLKGVGRKTANLVLGLGFGIPAICVDTHVHRIINRLGWTETKDPFSTEMALKKLIPKNWMIKLNTILVAFGQNVCLPISPLCSKCQVKRYCEKVGVKRSR